MRQYILFVLVGMLLLAPYTASAAGLVPCSGAADCNFDALVKLAQNILNFIVSISVVIAAGMFAFAGFLYFTDGGSEKNISKAHTIFTSVAIGLVIVLVAWLLVDTILKNLTGKGLDERSSNPSSLHIDIPRAIG